MNSVRGGRIMQTRQSGKTNRSLEQSQPSILDAMPLQRSPAPKRSDAEYSIHDLSSPIMNTGKESIMNPNQGAIAKTKKTSTNAQDAKTRPEEPPLVDLMRNEGTDHEANAALANPLALSPRMSAQITAIVGNAQQAHRAEINAEMLRWRQMLEETMSAVRDDMAQMMRATVTTSNERPGEQEQHRSLQTSKKKNIRNNEALNTREAEVRYQEEEERPSRFQRNQGVCFEYRETQLHQDPSRPYPDETPARNVRPIRTQSASYTEQGYTHSDGAGRVMDDHEGTERTPKIRVERWGISFGDEKEPSTVEDFIFRVEHLKHSHGISWEEVVKEIHKLLQGRVREWYWLFLRMHGEVDWFTLKEALVRQYKSNRSDFEVMQELMERKQHSNESIDDYFHQMMRMRSQLRSALPEIEMVKIIKKNLAEPYAHTLYPMTIYNVEQLRIECHEVEKVFPRRSSQPPFVTRHPNRTINVSEIADSGSHRRPMASNRSFPSRRNPQWRCWNCRELGHGFMDCNRPRNIFCYRCGREGVFSPQCPSCNQGNVNRNRSQASDTCSHQQAQDPNALSAARQ